MMNSHSKKTDMKKLFISIASAITALALSSCFQHEMTITLNKDGSGTVVEESLISAQMLAMLAQMAAGFGGEDGEAPDPTAELLSKEEAQKRAKELGEGVTLVKIEPVEVNGAKGARVTYAFTDINKLNADLGSGMNTMGSGEEEGGDVKNEQPIGFAYHDGKLTIKMPKPDKEANAEAAEEPDAQQIAMMKQIFADMKMGIKIVIAPGIADTNASHRDGDTITLVAINFGKLAENPDNFKKLAATQSETDPAAMMAALKDIDGVKLETQPEVTVSLK